MDSFIPDAWMADRNPRIVLAILGLMVSVVYLVVGYLIRRHKQFLGWRELSKARDVDGLARWLGGAYLVMGILQLLVILALFAVSADHAITLFFASVVAGGVASVVLRIRSRCYL